MDEESFRRACGNFDIATCTAQLQGLPPEEASAAAKILEQHVRETSCLIEPRITDEEELKRASFIEFCRTFIQGRMEGGVLETFEKHLCDALLLERGYKTILAIRTQFPSGQWQPEIQLWAAFERAANEIEEAYNGMKHLETTSEEFFDPVAAQITRENAPPIAPDVVVASATKNLGATIMMLAWENGWNTGGRLVVPNRLEIEEEKVLQAGLTAYLCQMWRVLKQSDDHLRYFGGELVLLPRLSVKDDKDQTHTLDVLEFQLEQTTTLIDQMAEERLTRAKFGYMKQLEHTTNAEAKVAKTIEGTPLPPKGYISMDELHTFLVLGDLYCLPVESDKAVYKGLALKHWLRGYAVLKESLAQSDGEPIIEVRTFAEAELIASFVRAGLSEDQAKIFLAETTFNKGRSDLFDTPFVRSVDGNLHFFAPAYVGAELSSILTSMLSTNKVQFHKKGPAFEQKIRDRLIKSGLNAKTIHFEYQGKNLECDAAFVWENKLFVFECKNNTLSGANSIASYRFWEGMHEATEQLERMRDAFTEDPNRVKKYLGNDAVWEEMILCVINAMPWSPGKIEDIYFYDSSALVKFFDEGVITLTMPIPIAEKIIGMHTHPFRLWAGDQPVTTDFLKELTSPIQVRILEDEWELEASLARLSRELAMVSPFWKRKSPDIQRTLKALGMDDAAIEKLQASLRQSSKMAGKLKEMIKEK